MSKESNKDFFQFALKKAVQEEETRIIDYVNKAIKESNEKINKYAKEINAKYGKTIGLINNLSNNITEIRGEYKKAIEGYNRIIIKYNKLSKLLGGDIKL